MARYASMVVVAPAVPIQTANILKSFYRMYVPRVPAGFQAVPRAPKSRTAFRVLVLPRCGLVDLSFSAKARGLLSMHRGSFTSN